MEKKGVGIQNFEGIHHVDHLGVICIGMNIPLLFTDEKTYLLAKHYYPDLQARLVDFYDMSPQRLAAQYDILFSSNFSEQHVFKRLFKDPQIEHGKEIRLVYCPHGNSDKGHSTYMMELFAEEDIVLLYGQRMIDFLKEKLVFERIKNYIITGNYRYAYYLEHQQLLDQVIEEEVLRRLRPGKKNILYAPTWNQGDSSFFTAYSFLFDQLPEEYNLIVKIHPTMESEHLGAVYRILSQYEGKEGIFFLKDFPLIYPLLAKSDIYIGDMSSIGYDALAFDLPMFFLNQYGEGATPKSDFHLFQCGIQITPSFYSTIYDCIKKHLSEDKERFSEIRKNTLIHTFGAKLRSFAEIKQDLWNIVIPKVI